LARKPSNITSYANVGAAVCQNMFILTELVPSFALEQVNLKSRPNLMPLVRTFRSMVKLAAKRKKKREEQ
jgi:hypothetical protein